MTQPLVVVGDTLLDRDIDGMARRLAPEGPTIVVDEHEERQRPGGAGLAALLAAASDREVVLVTALSADAGGARLRQLLNDAGVRLIDLGLRGRTPEKVRIRGDGHLLLKLDSGHARPAPTGDATPEALEALASACAVLVSDYGGNLTRSPRLRAALARLARGGLPTVWDPHPRCQPPLAGTLLATPNVREAAHFSGEQEAAGPGRLLAQGRALLKSWEVTAVAITRGERGALLVSAGGSATSIGATSVDGDCCGAGDSFAASAALSIAAGLSVAEAVAAGVAGASRFVAAGGVASLPLTGPPMTSPSVLPSTDVTGNPTVARVRAAGGTVVATGGCFDLLHAGHLAVLQEARALGDCLIVCVNSDESVRALKGPTRPVLPQEDRVALLRALSCVDEVLIFDEPTPDRLLSRLRPDIWAKGGDYAVDELPEADLVRSWGGQVVTLPYVPGRSSTLLLERSAGSTAAGSTAPAALREAAPRIP